MAEAKKQKNSTTEKIAEPKFSKEQIAASERYRNYRDLVEALLDDEKKYTYEAVDKLIENYKKGQVK